MSSVTVSGSGIGNAFEHILMGDDIQPGADPSYTLCKLIFLYHPLGQKMADGPIKMAQSQIRSISVAGEGEQRIIKAFKSEWEALGCDRHIRNLGRQARIYGISSLAILTEGKGLDSELDYKKLAFGPAISVSVFDPLNTAGSLVLSQITTDMDFQKVIGITVGGESVHRSRFVVLMNEEPIYIAYTPSAFGFVGRSVYQRALYPLKSFLQTMITDDLVSVKAGVMVAMLKQAGSIVDNLMMKLFGTKRAIVKEAKVGNVISIDVEEKIETLNFRNMDGPYQTSRENILKNIATAADMPAKLLENETFVEGFGEGTEDAKTIAKYIDGIRAWLQPVYSFFDQVVMYRAWNEEFVKQLKKDVPALKDKSYQELFYEWKNRFTATWPDVLAEPPSKLIKVDQAKMRAIMKLMDTLIEQLDPENRSRLIKWAAINFNELDNLFPKAPLELDYELLKNYTPPQLNPNKGPGEDDDGDGRELGDEEEDEDQLEDRGEREEDYSDSVKRTRRTLPRVPQRRVGHVKRRDDELNTILEDLSALRDSMFRGATSRADSERLERTIEVMSLRARSDSRPSNVNVTQAPTHITVQQAPQNKRVKMRRLEDGTIEAHIYTDEQVISLPGTHDAELVG